ncbi:hypothetical protein HC723_12085 [Vibrio sp. S11_S32]|uniref:hypothetical protein n=1 Tax=Vibrio sp. S11_S32 TaxID=2720225 RepID=UPI0016805622|nr:hypothetical protein [Vibrio sp. S11_S32]MBD1577172.1 hypothetical protein [Vibrio sp. S11_S32]
MGDEAQSLLEQFCDDHQIPNADKFIAIASVEIEKLHSGAIVGLGVSEAMFLNWRKQYDR